MRDLNTEQKLLLRNWYNQNKDKIQMGIAFFDWSKCDLFPIDLYARIEMMNDFEILSQAINNYIQQLAGY